MRIIMPNSDFNSMIPPSGTKTVARLLTNEELKSIQEYEMPDSSVFMAHCPCGSEDFYVKEEDGILYLICALCGYRFIIYNPAKHGIQSLEYHDDKLHSEEKSYSCTTCTHEVFNTLLIYRYPVKDGQPASNLIKPEDAFSKLIVLGTCINCGARGTYVDLNC
ncbi:MAG: hypothetical protein HYV28_12085 [Ignavibacteriales bacterium]|nr:hypothetical protein [Ignavibacteriales bacterium]